MKPGELDASGPTGLVSLVHDENKTREYVRLRVREDGSVYAVPMTYGPPTPLGPEERKPRPPK